VKRKIEKKEDRGEENSEKGERVYTKKLRENVAKQYKKTGVEGYVEKESSPKG